MDAEEAGYFKIDSKGNLMDMRLMTKEQLKALLSFYQSHLHRARSSDMKKAYDHCVQQISEYTYDGEVSGPIDIFTLCNSMGLTDVRTFIKTYLVSVKTQEELGRDKYMDYFRNRKIVFANAPIPTDEIIKQMFKAVVQDKPPALENAAILFTEYYKIAPVVVKLSKLDHLTSYDMEHEIITMNPEIAQIQLGLLEALLIGLFEHLCEKRSWQFNKDPDVCFVNQREETGKYVARFFFRCHELGLLPPPHKA